MLNSRLRMLVVTLLVTATVVLGLPQIVEAGESSTSGTCYQCNEVGQCFSGYMLGGYTCFAACARSFDCAIT
jgi:hypothetical protein